MTEHNYSSYTERHCSFVRDAVRVMVCMGPFMLLCSNGRRVYDGKYSRMPLRGRITFRECKETRTRTTRERFDLEVSEGVRVSVIQCFVRRHCAETLG